MTFTNRTLIEQNVSVYSSSWPGPKLGQWNQLME
jgi:hypothetical protein